MSDVRPELVFVSGPQLGERVVLTSNIVVIGRSPAADVQLTELHASREHVRFQLTRDGWIIENLSANGTLVNGKRFKSRKKKILLDTGDVLGVGLETEILFVCPGDDTETALHAYRKTHPLPTNETEKTSANEEPSSVPAPQSIPESAATEQAAKPERPTSKIRKYAIAYLIFLGLLVILFIILSSMRKNKGPSGRGVQLLSDREIAEILSEIPRENPIPTRSVSELRKARSLYDNLPSKTGDLYRCVRSFNLYLGYKRKAVFDNVQDERNYQTVRDRLIGQVVKKYRNAWTFAQAKNWSNSLSGYEELLLMLPEPKSDNRVQERLLRNIREHITYNRGKIPKKRKRR